MVNRLFLPLATATLLGCSNNTAAPTATPQEAAAEQDEQLPAPATVAEQEATHVIVTDTQYYLTGPQQARPPDGTMKAGTHVNLIEEAGSYCRVRSEDGIEAYVATDALKTAQDEQ